MGDNLFLQAAMKRSYLTENGAISNHTTGSALLDYFSKAGTYRGREQELVDQDMEALWIESPQVALRIIFYNRLITRKMAGMFESDTVQRGQGGRDEFRKALNWLARTHPETSRANLWLVPIVGRWSDLWHVDLIDVIPREESYQLVQRGLQDPLHRDLIAKYLPRVRSASKTFSERHQRLNSWARGFAQAMGWSAKEYRCFKSDPTHTSHQFQRDMCAGQWDQLDFSRIPGRALLQLVKRNLRSDDKKSVLDRHDLVDRYMEWISSQPTLPFKGYVYELYQSAAKFGLYPYQSITYDKQFDGLIALAEQDRGGLAENVWCALDTSGSMVAQAIPGVSALDICLGLGIYFSALNQGHFQNHVVMFDTTSRVLELKGTFSDRVKQLLQAVAAGSTNFQSVIDLICQIRKDMPSIPIAEYPTTLLVVSDMQFNPVGSNTQTNYEAAMQKLSEVGLPPIKIVWWWVTGRGKDFPSTLSDQGVTMISGFDGAIIELLLDQKSTSEDDLSASTAPLPDPYEQMLTALDQEVLRQLK